MSRHLMFSDSTVECRATGLLRQNNISREIQIKKVSSPYLTALWTAITSLDIHVKIASSIKIDRTSRKSEDLFWLINIMTSSKNDQNVIRYLNKIISN